MTILYLYAELMGYQIPVFKEYVSSYNADVHVVHWDDKKLTPYVPPVLKNVHYYKRSEYNRIRLKKLVDEIKPTIVYVSGWMDKEYMLICRDLRKNGIPVLAGSDTQWKGSLKQIIGSFYFRFFYKKCFSHIWVSGTYQYEYARKLGFKKQEILFNCLSADVELFSSAFKVGNLEDSYPKRFLFLGRFEEVKGISLLLDTWTSISDKKGWSLTFIGNGSLREKILKNDNVRVIDFIQPEDLVKEVSKYGCLVLPSIKEPWALVIHEMMAAGLPVVASNVCGAAPTFIVPGQTGSVFKAGDIDSLKMELMKFMSKTNVELFELGRNAFDRSKVINPKIVAATFISVLK